MYDYLWLHVILQLFVHHNYYYIGCSRRNFFRYRVWPSLCWNEINQTSWDASIPNTATRSQKNLYMIVVPHFRLSEMAFSIWQVPVTVRTREPARLPRLDPGSRLSDRDRDGNMQEVPATVYGSPKTATCGSSINMLNTLLRTLGSVW